MTAWMEPFAFWLADVYLAATILLLATAVIFALVKQPSLRMAVAWGIVPGLLLVAGLCLSPSRPHVGLRPARQIETNGPAQRSLTSRRLYAGGLQAALDAQSKTAGVKPAARTDDLPIGNTMEAVSVDESDRLQSERFEREPAAPIASSPVVTGVSESGRPSWAPRLVAGLVSVFLAGSLFVASWLVLGVWRASRLVRESDPAPQACLDELHALVGAPCRPPRLRVNRRLLTPVATGAVRPAILLPEESSRGGEPHALRAVLAHEWTHIKNGDLWLLALDRIVLSLLWAHPLYWWTRRRFRADQEFLADAAAAAQIGAADYAALLLHWARKVTEQRSLTASTAVGIWERPAGLTERVTTLLADSNREIVRTSGRTRVGVAAALALLSLAAATISLRPPQSQMARAELAQAELARAEDKSDTHSGPTVAPPAPATPIVQSPPENESPQSEPAQNTSNSNDVQGTCGDRLGKPLAGVQISLYAIQKANGRAQLLRQGTTDAEGRFRFPDCLGKKAVQLSWQLHDEDGAVFEVFARRADLGTGVKLVQGRGQELDFKLTKAASLTGTVRDRQGRPIAGAIIREMYQPLPKTGWLSAKSDEKGNFTIADLSEYQYAGPSGSGPPLGLLSVEHPGYSTAKASYNRVPVHVEVVLGNPATIEGTVAYGDSGKPAAGVFVFANRIEEPIPAITIDLPPAKTDKNGRYTLRPLPEGLFNLYVSTEPITGILSFATGNHSWVAAPIEQFRTKEGQTATAPPIRLVKGGVVKGSLYQYRPGVNGVHDPVKLKEDEKLEIIVFYGPSLPNPGVVADMTFVRPDGTFELRLPPGMHYLSLPSAQKADGTGRLPYSDMGEPCTEEDAAPPQLNNLHRIKIREGQTIEIELSVFRPSPPQKTVDDKKTQIERPNATQLAEAPKPVDQRVDSGAIAGTFVDQRRAPVRGAEVLLFRTNWQEMTQQLVGQTSTDEAGRFEFNRSLAGRARKDNLTVVVRHEGLATLSVSGSQLGKSLDFVMPPAATLKGTVRDPAGKPVAGALVNFGSSQFVTFLPLPIEGIRCARTDAMGQFAVSDLEEFKYKPSVPPRNWHSGWSSLGPPSITIVHPDFARIWVKYFEVPGDVDVVLPDRAGTIEGQVVTAETGKPAAGVIVSVGFDRRSGIVREVTHEVTRTGPDGRYRVTSLPEESYGVWVSSSPTDQTAPVIESLAVHAGGTARAPVLRLVKGGVIEGRIVDEITGKHGAGITVDLQGVDQQKGKASSYFDQTVTDGNGHYRFASLPGGKFNLFVDDDTHLDAAAAAVDSFEIHAGQTATAPPIRLVRGGLIKGLIIDDATGKAVRLRAGDYLDIQSHGPARPRSGAAVQVAKIREDGTFEIRLPPGGSWLGVRNNRSIDITGDGGGEYSLSDGGVINVEYHVRRYDPSKESASNAAPVQQPLGEHERYSTKIIDYHIGEDEIGGMCQSADEARLKGVEVALYIRSFGGQADNWGAKPIDQTTTNDEGQFVFRHVPQVDPRDVDYLMVARRHGRITMVGIRTHRHDWLDLRMPAARPFKGTVKNEQGKPVAGALVRCDGSPFYDLPEGIQSARTNARGEFEIDDVGGAGRCVVEHPDYARKTVEHLPFDEPAELKVRPGGVVEGQVVDTVTGKPASGLSVSIQPINQVPQLKLDDVSFFWASTKTDSQGLFRIESIPSGQFNVFVSSAPGRASVALDSLAVPAGDVVQAPPIRLVKPGVVKGRLIDDLTGQPALVGDDERVTIGVHGPSRPRSGAAIEGFAVKADGTFELRLPPGRNSVYVSGGPFLVRKPGDPSANQDIRQIDVKEGAETTIEFRVIRQVPMKPAPEKTIKNSPPPSSGAVNRPSPIVLAEAPTVSPKIVDYHVAKDEIGGMCLGRGEARLSGVDVSLYLETVLRRGARRHDLLGRTATNEQGQFLFQHVRHLDSGEAKSAERYVIVARRKGLATEVSALDHAHDWVDLKMGDAVAVRGTVKDEQGKPVVGAIVRCNDNAWRSLADEVHSARTDALGQFQIDDVATVWGCVIEHPDYPAKVLYDESTFLPREGSHFSSDVLKLPLNVTLVKGSVVEGQVIDSVTRRPGVGLTVTMQAIQNQNPYIGQRIFFAQDPCLFSTETQTDDNGHYRFTRLPAGRFTVYLTSDVPARASIALHSLDVPAATAVHAPDIRLIKGGIVHGRLIDDQSGQPARLGEDEKVTITVDGPARPRQREIQAYLQPQSFPVAADGTFQLRLPPGKNLVRVSGRPYFAEQPADRNANQDIRELEIEQGQEATLEFRVVRLLPLKRQSSGVTSNASSSVDAGGAKPEWFHVRSADIGGIWSDAVGHGIAGAKVTLIATDADGSKRKVVKATTTNSWGQFLFVCAPCLAGPNQHYELVLSRDNESPDVRKTVHPGEWLELKASPIEFRGIHQVPMEEPRVKSIKKPPAKTSGAVTRPAAVMVAEAPSVSPKIVDYHLEKEAVGGLCLGRDETRIRGVEVSLYIIGPNDDSHRYIGRTMTNEEGQYVFRQVPQLRPREPRYLGNDEEYLMIARKKGLATALGTLRQRHDWLDLRMRPGVSMNGVVQDEQGHPVAGALVRGSSYPNYGVPEEAPSVRTNERGEFQIDDLEHFGAAFVSHPDYMNAGFGKATKNPVVATLRKGSIVEGQVIDGETGQPVAETLVTLEPLGRYRGMFAPRDRRAGVGALEARTDANGRYRFRSLRPGTFWLSFRGGPGGVATAVLDELKVGRQQTVEVPPVRISKGATVMVRLISDDGRRHIAIEPNEAIVIGIRSGEASASADSKPRLETIHMRPDGTFAVWLPAGKHAISLNGGPFFSLGDMQQGIGHDLRQVDIKGGEDATVIFGVIGPVPKAPEKPMKNSPAPAGGAVNRPEPVMLAEAPTISPKIVDYHLENDAVGGLCRGFDKSRLVGVEVSLYVIHHVQSEDRTHELIGRTITNDEGQFVFPHVPEVKPGDESYEFIARRHGNGTTIGHLNVRHGWVDLWLPPGVAVKGIVKDQQGQPIADAQIRVNWNQGHELPEGILKSRTDARGEFEIDDAPEAAIFHVSHPDYLSDGFKRTAKTDRHFQALPNPVEITLKKAGVIEGQVVLGDTGQPAAGVLVTLQELGWEGASDNRFRWFHPHATTDSTGHYWFRTLPAQRFNLSVRGGPQGLASAGIDAIEVRLGQTVEAPLLRLAKGGLVHGRLINNISGKPQTVREDHVLSIGIASAAEPKAKPAVENLHVRADGTFEFWLPPGKSSVYLSGGPFFAVGDAEQGIGHDRREIDVKPGTEYSVEFRVVRIGPTRISDRPRTQRGS